MTWIGLVGNLVLAAAKLAAGFWGKSQAVFADGVHSLSDCASDIAILVGVRYWVKPPDEEHPHGHRRIETFVALFIGFLLTLAAGGLLLNALLRLGRPAGEPPGLIALWAALLSIVCKELLYRWTASVGRRVKSEALIANAWHHRSDALSSIPAALAVAGAAIHPHWAYFDSVGALIVSVFILHAAYRIVLPAFRQLADTGAPPETTGQIRAIALAVESVEEVHAIRTRYIGSGLQVDLHVLVDGSMSVRVGHDITGIVKRRLLDQGPDVVDVIVHLEPCENSAE